MGLGNTKTKIKPIFNYVAAAMGGLGLSKLPLIGIAGHYPLVTAPVISTFLFANPLVGIPLIAVGAIPLAVWGSKKYLKHKNNKNTAKP